LKERLILSEDRFRFPHARDMKEWHGEFMKRRREKYHEVLREFALRTTFSDLVCDVVLEYV
jgi:hypothetical protein